MIFVVFLPWLRGLSLCLEQCVLYCKDHIVLSGMCFSVQNVLYRPGCTELECIALSRMHCTVQNALYCSECIVLFIMHCTVQNALYCSECIVLSRMHCTVQNALYCSECIVLFRIYCTVQNVAVIPTKSFS